LLTIQKKQAKYFAEKKRPWSQAFKQNKIQVMQVVFSQGGGGGRRCVHIVSPDMCLVNNLQVICQLGSTEHFYAFEYIRLKLHVQFQQFDSAELC
jgi:hypothetical protein